MPIHLRPHHLICGLCFKSRGFRLSFLENFNKLNKILTENPEKKSIRIVEGLDDICEYCEKRKGNKCEKDPKARLLDVTYLDALELKVGQMISLNEAKAKIRSNLVLAGFQDICKDCPSREEGLCEPNFDALVKENK